MSGRPALDILGQEMRRGEEDYGPLDGTEYVAIFSHKDAQGRPKEGRKEIRDISFDVPDFLVSAAWGGGTISHGTQQIRAVNVPGAEMAARVIVSYDQDLKGCFTHGYVMLDNGVNCYVANLTGATQILAAGTLYVSVWNIEAGALPEPEVEGSLLLETGDEILLETGDEILLG